MTSARVAAGVAAAVLVLAAAGCSSGDGDIDDSTPPAPEETPTEPGETESDETEPDDEEDSDPQASGSSDISDDFGSVEGYEGALGDVALAQCEGSEDGVQVSGELENSTGEARSYRIYVSVSSDGDTLAIKQVDVAEVAAGESAEWETVVDATGDPVDCVLRVERFAPLES